MMRMNRRHSRFLGAVLTIVALGTAAAAQQDERWTALEQQIGRIYGSNE